MGFDGSGGFSGVLRHAKSKAHEKAQKVLHGEDVLDAPSKDDFAKFMQERLLVRNMLFSRGLSFFNSFDLL